MGLGWERVGRGLRVEGPSTVRGNNKGVTRTSAFRPPSREAAPQLQTPKHGNGLKRHVMNYLGCHLRKEERIVSPTGNSLGTVTPKAEGTEVVLSLFSPLLFSPSPGNLLGNFNELLAI